MQLLFYLQRVAGYCLTGLTSEHVLFFLYGTGANGKSVFVETLAGVLGDYAVAAPMETFVETLHDRHPTELAMLRGARLVTASETQSGRRWNEARIKQLTGGDKIAARFMRQDFFEFTPQFKLMISGNHKPSLRNVNEAIRRRIHLVPFTVTIPPAERDRDLAEKLKAEWPGIMAWAVQGALAWRKQGLNPPPAVIDATNEYLASEDAIGLWLEECTVQDPNGWEKSTALFGSWKAWAEKAGERIGSQKAFSQTLEERGLGKRRGNTGSQGFTGIRLKPAASE
jgi:putative DNA primase/helicase